MSFVKQLVSYIIMYFVIYDNLWFKYNMIYSMFDFITPIPWCIIECTEKNMYFLIQSAFGIWILNDKRNHFLKS